MERESEVEKEILRVNEVKTDRERETETERKQRQRDGERGGTPRICYE